MTIEEDFREQRVRRIQSNGDDRALVASAQRFLEESIRCKYCYNFNWLGRPIIQYPQDIVAMQELVWRIRPDLIIETGIAHGGSLILSASMLALLDLSDAAVARRPLDPRASSRRVIGIDIDIRSHNRSAIEAHPLAHMITMIEGSSTAAEVVSQVAAVAARHPCVLVCLDSNHTHDHVLNELRAYAPLVTQGSYCIVFDTVVESLPARASADRPWSPGNSPLTAVTQFLSDLSASKAIAADGAPLCFEVDMEVDSKLLVSVAPKGYLRRIARPLPTSQVRNS
jgi:cephalosporin hydroxylase